MPDLSTQVPAAGVDSQAAATTPKAGEVDSSSAPPEPEQQPTDPKLADAVRTRDEAKQRARDAEASVESLTARVAELESSQAELEETRAQLQTLRDEREQRQAADRHETIERAILGDANPQHVDALKLMIPGLIETGVIDLAAEDLEDACRKARRTIGQQHPTFYRPADGTPQGGRQGFPARLQPRRSSAI
jgi:vacuolar-type H+-ATPase subunit I/STV1